MWSCLCLRPVVMQVEAHPSSCIPKPLSWFVVLGCWFLLVFFFNLLDLVYFLMWFVFLTVCSPLWWCCLKCLFRGHGICLGLTSLKSQRLSCS